MLYRINMFIAALIVSYSAVTQAATAKPTVGKVTSYVCNTKSNQRLGSGTLLEAGGKLFVLTSAHVVFHSTLALERMCATFESDRKVLTLNYFAINFANGLALFEVAAKDLPTAQPMKKVLWNDMQVQAEIDTSPAICLTGLPFGSATPLNDCNARILNAHSNRTILPLIDEVLEIDGHSEYGMSGGAVFSAEGAYLGLISHQYLSIDLGRPATIQDYVQNGHSGELIGLAIPTVEIVPWIKIVLADPKAGRAVEAFRDQIKHLPKAVNLSSVKFTERNCDSVDVSPGGIGGDGVGIGGDGKRSRGGDGVGIGGDGKYRRGGDGVGIGGDNTPTAPSPKDPANDCHIDLSINDDPNFSQEWPFSTQIPTWLETVRAHLKDNPKDVLKMEYIDMDDAPERVTGLMQAFTWIAHGNLPVMRDQGPGIVFVKIAAGSFLMGPAAGEVGSPTREQHPVTIAADFYMQTTEVTQKQYFDVMGVNPAQYSSPETCLGQYTTIGSVSMCPEHPVDTVSWDDIQIFLQKKNAQGDGFVYRLPTEEEWEYAERAGQVDPAFFLDNLDATAWYGKNSAYRTHRVATKLPNAWGLFDMIGNVNEWTGTLMIGPVRIYRGGNFLFDEWQSIPSFFAGFISNSRLATLGFRLVRTPVAPQ